MAERGDGHSLSDQPNLVTVNITILAVQNNNCEAEKIKHVL